MSSISLSDQPNESQDEPVDSSNVVQVVETTNEEQTETENDHNPECEVSLPNVPIEKDAANQTDTIDNKTYDSELPEASLPEQHVDPISMANTNDLQKHEDIVAEQVEQSHTIDQINPSSESVCSSATLTYQDEVGGNFKPEFPTYLAPTKAFLAKRREPAKVLHKNPFRFARHANSEPERFEESEEPYIPLAVRIRQTALRTPSRFRRRPDPVKEAPTRRMGLPHSPVLTSQYRTRATRSVEPSDTTYHANPVDRKALDSHGEIGVPRMKRRLPTIPHSPVFSSKRQRCQHFSDSDSNSTAVKNNAYHEVSNPESIEQEPSIVRTAEILTVSAESNIVVTEISNLMDEAC